MVRRIILLLPVLLITLSACNLDNSGYPRRMQFGVNGGTREVRGSRATTNVTICSIGGGKTLSNMDENRYGEYQDSFIMAYDWLEVKGKVLDGKLIVTVTPNTTGHKRELMIQGSEMDTPFYVTVKQAGQ